MTVDHYNESNSNREGDISEIFASFGNMQSQIPNKVEEESFEEVRRLWSVEYVSVTEHTFIGYCIYC